MCLKDHSEALNLPLHLKTPATLNSLKDTSTQVRASEKCPLGSLHLHFCLGKSLKEPTGSICKGRLILPPSTGTAELHCLLPNSFKNCSFSDFVQLFSCLVYTGKSGSYYCISAESRNSACQYPPYQFLSI